MQASFHRREAASLDQQALMPSVPPPESLPTAAQRTAALLADPNVDPVLKQMLRARPKTSPIDTRWIVDPLSWSSPEAKKLSVREDLMRVGMPSQMMWFR